VRVLPPFLWPVIFYAGIFTLHAALPARVVDGYVLGADGKPLRYRLNGLLVFFVSISLWAAACRGGLLAWDALYLHRVELLASACVLGLLFTGVVVFTAPPTPSFFRGVFLGRVEQPRWLGDRVDLKMFLYLLGATMLELNLLSFAAHHALTFSQLSPGVLLYVALFSFFLVEYLFFERVHLYTWDFVAEGVGFKLGWGCFVFYPFFYGIGLWTTAHLPGSGWPLWALGLIALLFFLGWSFARGANLQKYAFKRDPSRAPDAIGGKILASGFWGLSRHINYLGEVLMATALTLALGHPEVVWPWLYPLYYVLMLSARQRDDDKRCAAKYGALWEEYCRRVPWRIVPYVY
jgi:protein-S-isoprenylcysteine O-methyltransferase Ste14